MKKYLNEGLYRRLLLYYLSNIGFIIDSGFYLTDHPYKNDHIELPHYSLHNTYKTSKNENN